MIESTELFEYLNKNTADIISKISHEDISVYMFLSEQFHSTDISKNYLFQFVYRSYYRLDNAGLSNEFKKAYFELMQEQRTQDNFTNEDIKRFLIELSNYPTKRGYGSVQFSFITKFLNIINKKYPIYDSKIASLLHLKIKTNYKNVDQKINEYLKIYDALSLFLNEEFNNGSFKNILLEFDKKFNNINIPQLRKIDYILWSAGKLLDKKEKRKNMLSVKYEKPIITP